MVGPGDEAPGRLNLRYALAEHPDWQLCGEFAGAAVCPHIPARDLMPGIRNSTIGVDREFCAD
jgi:hypothetical protein